MICQVHHSPLVFPADQVPGFFILANTHTTYPTGSAHDISRDPVAHPSRTPDTKYQTKSKNKKAETEGRKKSYYLLKSGTMCLHNSLMKGHEMEFSLDFWEDME